MNFTRPISPLDFFYRDVILGLIYLALGFGLPLGCFVLVLYIDKHAADIAIYGSFGLGLVAVIAVYLRYGRTKQTPEGKEIVSKLKERLNAGELLVTETTATLKEEDIESIRKFKFWLTILVSLSMALALYFIYQASVLFSTYPMNWVITGGSAILLTFLVYKYAQLLDRVIEKGEKTVVRGIVTKKYYKGGRHGSYYIELGTLPFMMWRYPYMACNIGDELELEVLKNFGNWVLKRKTVSRG